MTETQPGGLRAGKPFWARVGGGLLVAGSVLALAEVVFWSIAQSAGTAPRLFVVNTVLLLVSGLVLLAALVALAFGRRGSDGIVAGSVTGKVALVVFAATQLIASMINAAYFAIPPQLAALALGISNAAVALAFLAIIIAAVVIARRRVAQGVARWSMFAIVAIGPVTAAAVIVAPGLGQILNIASVVVQGAVGMTYYLSRNPPPAPHANRDNRENTAQPAVETER